MYKFIKINQDTYPRLKELYFLSFGINTSISYLRKKYDTSAFGLSHVGFIALSENGETAANYCVFPVILHYESKNLLVAQSGDTMTAPKHQKKGLFIQLANKTYSLAEELGICLIFGFPNENSYPGFKNKLNWEFHGNMQRFIIKKNVPPICELSSKFKLLSKYYDSYVNKKLKKYKVDVNSINLEIFNYTKNKGLIKKDRHFFNYKQNQKKNYLISINGFFIYLKAGPHLIIGDIGKIEKDDGPKLIKTLNQLAVLLLCRKVIIDVSKNHWLYEILIDFILPINSLPIGFRHLNEDISVEKIQFVGADYDTF